MYMYMCMCIHTYMYVYIYQAAFYFVDTVALHENRQMTEQIGAIESQLGHFACNCDVRGKYAFA